MNHKPFFVKIILASALFGLCAFILYFFITSNKMPLPLDLNVLSSEERGSRAEAPPIQNYLGSQSCVGCHSTEATLWQNSHHDQSMQHASDATVKGDFNNRYLNAMDFENHFFKRDDQFWVSTEGSDGNAAEFQVLYTFGTEPLQQYLVDAGQGRLQALPLAWDTLKGQWFHLQLKLKPEAGEWIHWTSGGMNWNSMCADCHSTGYVKNYDEITDSYQSSWKEIDVACEACHGPGSAHVSQMTRNEPLDPTLLDMISGELPQHRVEKCGRCHARRQQLTPDFVHGSDTLLDHYVPETLRAGLYHADGQIHDEVFVYGSYTQSKMYQMGVSCTSCHDPHSAQLKKIGNDLCTSCHLPDKYDSANHHHHTPAGESIASDESRTGTGDQCVDCHMPGRVYMTNDFRRDHSLRVPRPDLSVQFGTPNACSDCHSDQSAQWAATAVEDWFGGDRPKHFSETLALATKDALAARNPLIDLLLDRSQVAIARATAAELLIPLVESDQGIFAALKTALADVSPLVRATVARSFYVLPLQDKATALLPLLNDPVRAVRIAAARSLVEIQANPLHFDALSPKDQQTYRDALKEYQDSLTNDSDFAYAPRQRGLDATKMGQTAVAAQQFTRALTINDRENTTRMNLAQIRYQQGQYDAVEALYQKVIEQEPNAAPPYYALGLLLAERGRFDEAEMALETAAIKGENPRAWYNLAVLRHQQSKHKMAETAYLKAIALAPNNVDFIQGLASLYAQQQQWQPALDLVNEALKAVPADPQLLRLHHFLRQSKGKKP